VKYPRPRQSGHFPSAISFSRRSFCFCKNQFWIALIICIAVKPLFFLFIFYIMTIEYSFVCKKLSHCNGTKWIAKGRSIRPLSSNAEFTGKPFTCAHLRQRIGYVTMTVFACFVIVKGNHQQNEN
jgi:hypothetical protein